MSCTSKNNKYDYFISVAISLLAFGVIGGALQPIRIFLIMLAPLLIINALNSKIKKREVLFIVMCLLWLSYSIISLAWIKSYADGLVYLISLLINFMLFYLIISFSKKAKNPVRSIIFGWMFAAGLTMPLAFYEVITNNHLSVTGIDANAVLNNGFEIIKFSYADATFGDLNSYSIFLVYSLFFILYRILKNKETIYPGLLSILLIYVILFNASRGAILTMLILIVGLGFSLFKNIKFLLIILLSVVLLAYALIGYIDLSEYRFIFRLMVGDIATDSVRIDILKSSWQASLDYLFLGAGVGSGVDVLNKYGAPVSNAHNLVFEILVQFGIFILVPFFVLVIYIIFKLFKNNNPGTKFLGYSFIFGFGPMFVVVSSYLLHPGFWSFLASLFVIATHQNKNLTIE